MSERETVGFIGLGLMGHGMAKNIVEKGWPLVVMAHRKREAVEDVIARGAEEVANAKAMAARCDVIFLCVTSSHEVEALIKGPDGILEGARPGLTIIDCSTSNPDSTIALAAELAGREITLIDSPLSRTPREAWSGELTTYVGASEADFERVKPLLSAWAAIVLRAGDVGTAHRLKLINNLVAMGYCALWAECFTACRKAGVSPQLFREVISNGGMNCGNFQNFSKYVCDGDPEGHKFAISNCAKDMRYYTQMADALGMTTLMSDSVLQTYKLAMNLGHGEDYMPLLVDPIAKLNGLAPGGGHER